MVWVKICGLTTPVDAEIAVALGADAIGTLVNVPSPRSVSPAKAKKILDKGTNVDKAVVIMPRDVDDAIRIARITHPTMLQLHGAEGTSFIDRLREDLRRQDLDNIKLIKAIGIDPPAERDLLLTACRRYLSLVDGFVFDTKTPKGTGGTGLQHDWNISRWLRERLPEKPVILAGGLNPGNVATAISVVNPFGVDVSTGVERAPGRKDAEMIKSFIGVAREASG